MVKVFYRLNQYIQADKIRVIDEAGKQIGVMSREEALSQARQKGLDLVEIAPHAKPPVGKIIDFKKFRFQEEKKRQREKKSAKKSELKEIRLSPFMAENDRQYKIKRAGEFLSQGNKVKLSLMFRGRQITKKSFGYGQLALASQQLAGTGEVEFGPKLTGNRLEMTLTPIKGAKDGQKKQTKN